MKKILSIALAVLMLASTLALASCGSKQYVCGVQSGTTGYSYMTGDVDWGFAGYENIKTNPYDNIGLAGEALLNGQVDFVVSDDAPAKSLVAAKSGLKFIDVALTTESYGIAVSKDDATLLSQINTVLAAKATEIKAIFAKYADVNDDNASTWSSTVETVAKDDSKADKQLVIATNAAFAPYEFKVGDKFAGIDIEIAKLIADELEMELVVVDMEFDSIVSSIGKNNVDIGIAAMTINAKRLKTVNFSDPYYSGAYQVVVCKDSCTLFDNCKTTEELVAVLNGLKK